MNESNITDASLSESILLDNGILYQSHKRNVNPREPNYEKARPYFAWLPVETIKKTFQATTQYARIPMSTILKKHYKSPFPAMNVHRRNEPIATDTVSSDTPATGSGMNDPPGPQDSLEPGGPNR